MPLYQLTLKDPHLNAFTYTGPEDIDALIDFLGDWFIDDTSHNVMFKRKNGITDFLFPNETIIKFGVDQYTILRPPVVNGLFDKVQPDA